MGGEMTITADIYEVAVLIIAIAFLVLVIASIPTLLQLKRTVRAIEELSTEGRKTAEVVNALIRKTGDQAGELEDLVKKAKEVGLKATGLADLVLDGIKSPMITILSLLLGLEFGLKYLIKKDEDKKTGGEDGAEDWAKDKYSGAKDRIEDGTGRVKDILGDRTEDIKSAIDAGKVAYHKGKKKFLKESV
jgi:hypothetical protein